MKLNNLGASSLRRRNRKANPMKTYDSLPKPLRNWMAQAALPWSPASCLRIWRAAFAAGGSEADALVRLQDAERVCLSKDRCIFQNGGIPDC
ncbi:DUF6525 family protein [Pelagimonas varians]|uniref:DUF6525 family protein n=1 Tax=Pelagimonas varians TaxID=696760 RepID=UPI000BEF189F|nr:DUF6525 family protein [Pelagimonas varians]